MIDKVKQFIIKHNLIPSSVSEVIAAVSGGIDSCVLLDILFRLQSNFKYKLKIVHFNHKVRAKASDDDEQFVLALAKKYGIDIEHAQFASTSCKISENHLRKARYQYYNEVLSAHPDAVIAMGHHRDDVIETFIMRLFKGSRLKGLRSILPKRDRFIRPMLSIARKEIKQYANENKIEYREDVTNFNLNIQRNLIRNRILPFLESELNDRIRNNIVKVLEDFTYHFQIYDDQLKKGINQSVIKSKEKIYLKKKIYKRLNPVIKRGLIEYCISLLYPLNYGISDLNFKLWDEFIEKAPTGKILMFKNNHRALAEREFIVFGFHPEMKERKYKLHPGDSVMIDDKYEISMQVVKRDDVRYDSNRYAEFINGNKSGKNLIVRFWRKGDKFIPLGMSHYRKLSDFFIDLKLNRSQKMGIPIVCKGDEIIWIVGYRLDERFKLSENTEIIYKLEAREID
jgi:tRNA(Ile)-lysidine synthase